MSKYQFKHWEDGSTDSTRAINLDGDKEINASYEKVAGLKYKPSEATVLVHVGRPSDLTVNPSEIGTVENPVDDGISHAITVMLTDNQDNPIEGKKIHLYTPDVATELDAQLTAANGVATLSYIADADHDNQNLIIKYLGD